MTIPALLLALGLQEPGGLWSESLFVEGTAPASQMGRTAAIVGDLNQDGIDDFILGAPRQTNNSGAYLAGAVHVFDGFTGQLIRQIEGSTAGGLLAWALCDIGDVNGDGVHEFGACAAGNPIGSPGAFMFDGASGVEMIAVSVPPESRSWGSAMDGVGDWNRDGIPDFAVADSSAKPNGMSWAGSTFI